MTQNGQFYLIHNFSNLFPLKLLKMTWNGQLHLICNFSNLFPPKWLRMTWNGQFHPICNFSNLFPLKWLRMTRNGQFCLIRNFSNLFPPKLLRITRNGQFCMAKIKYTLIQGNFYERLPFYMDSCALSPMASLSHLRCIWPPLFSMVLDTSSDDRYRQTKEINANARWARALMVHPKCGVRIHYMRAGLRT